MKKIFFTLGISALILSASVLNTNATCIVGAEIMNGYCNAVATVLPSGLIEIDLKCQSASNDSLNPATRCQLPGDKKDTISES